MRCGFLVEVQGYVPFYLEHVSRSESGQNHVKPVESDIAIFSLVNVPGQQYGACSFSGGASEDTGTSYITVAGFEI